MSFSHKGSLPEAIAHHQRGELQQAERGYRTVLAAQPDNPDALHLLGVLALQAGKPKQAVELIERAIAREPSQADYHANLGEGYRALGDPQRAAACCQVALRLRPDHAQAAYNLGSLLMHGGQCNEAAQMFRQSIQHRPDFALAHNNLGNAYRLLGDIEQALAHFRRATELEPGLGLAHGNLGQLLLENHKPREALSHCQEAVRLQPQSGPARNNLGNVFRKLRRLNDAMACYTEALRLTPNLATIPNNIGEVLIEEGKSAEALRWFVQAVQLDPNAARFHANLARVAFESRDLMVAESHLLTALRLEPRLVEARLLLAQLRFEQGRFEDARSEYRIILDARPDDPNINCRLGDVLMELNQREEAMGCFRHALRVDASCAPALAQLATHLRDKIPAEEFASLRRLLLDPGVSDTDRSILLFGVAQVCDARGEYDEAAQHLTRANDLENAIRKERGRSYDADAHGVFVDRLVNVFTPTFFDRVRGFGLQTERPVFIFGLPRSGTTLLEQVLASHSRVHGAGELRFARDDFETLGQGRSGLDEARAFDALEVIDNGGVCRLAQTHLDRLNVLNIAAERIIDKMPDNYLYVGFLSLLFPRARFLHCKRDLRDVAVSCWITHFRDIPWANNPDQIASRFAQYRRVMEHWQAVLPVPMLDVNYEDLVEDLEGTARRAVAFCGLEWEPGCLEYHRSQRPVRTASVAQVRQPIYRRSVERWRHYEKSLQPLFERLPGCQSRPVEQIIG